MAELIAIAGKGGVGKSTFSSLLIRYLLQRVKPILAVDADPNSNLPVLLGLKPSQTIGQILEEFMGAKLKIPAGMSKQSWLEMRISQAVVEGKGLDMIVMGRPEGTGCYCSANNVLRDFLEKMRENYKYVVVDNEAGMEHLSRRTEGKIDRLFIVSDATVKGLRTVANLLELVKELQLEIQTKYLILNRTNSPEGKIKQMLDNLDIQFLGAIPEDHLILEFDLEEKPILNLPESSISLKTSEELLDRVFAQSKAIKNLSPQLAEMNKEAAK